MPAIALAILDHRPDIVILTEYRRTTGGQIAAVLADHGLNHQVCTDPPAGRNGVLVAARTPISGWSACRAESLFSKADRRHPATDHRLVEVDLPELGVGLAALHIPPDGDRTRETVFGAAVEAARRRRDQAFILMGDFNAGRHHLDEAGATFSCTRLFGTLAALGYADAWRTLHPSGREYTWFSHEGGGFRIDHCFVSGPMAGRLSACWHSHKERENGLSDHSILVAALDTR
jgi:exonuclease III